jgi:hypothetical protein
LDRATALRIQRARAARAGTTRTARTTAAGTARTAAATTAAAAAIIGERLAIGTEARRARRQRLAIGAEARAARGQGLAVGAEARAARGQGLAVGAEARAARGQGLAVGAEARAARTAGAAWATSVAVAAGAAGATAIAAITARAAAARTAAVVARIARRAGQLPADAGAGHLAARGAVVVATLAFLRTAALVADGLEAAEAARLVATAGAAEAAATTAAAATAGTTAIAAAATAVVATTAAAVIAAAAALRRTRNAVHRVVVLADGRGAGRALLALEDADESHRLDVGADDVERLDQALRAVGRDGDLAGDALGEGLALEALCRLGSAGGGSATEKESRELGQRLHGNEPWRAGACLTPSRARLATGLWRKASPGALASATTRCGITPASGSVSCTHPGNRNNAENGDGVTPRP